MSETISIAAAGITFLGYSALTMYLGTGTAISAEAADIRRSACVVVESGERSHALFGEKSGAISELQALARECAAAGWDGESATGLDPIAVRTALNFIRALPSNIPLPEFAPEPDGSVSLDWITSRYRRFTLSIGASSRLAYAWLDGTDKGHGVANFDGSNIPPRVLEGIRSISNNAAASFRAA